MVISIMCKDIETHPSKHIFDIIFVFPCKNSREFKQIIDGVYPGMFLEIVDDGLQESEVLWLTRYWGHVKLHNVKWTLNKGTDE